MSLMTNQSSESGLARSVEVDGLAGGMQVMRIGEERPVGEVVGEIEVDDLDVQLEKELAKLKSMGVSHSSTGFGFSDVMNFDARF